MLEKNYKRLQLQTVGGFLKYLKRQMVRGFFKIIHLPSSQ